MKPLIPRFMAICASIIGAVGFVVSLPLLLSLPTSLFFLLGLSVWVFFPWRAISSKVGEIFHIGWLWSCFLHAGCLVLSIFLPSILGTSIPVPVLILCMLIISFVGLISEVYSTAKFRKEEVENSRL